MSGPHQCRLGSIPLVDLAQQLCLEQLVLGQRRGDTVLDIEPTSVLSYTGINLESYY